jgi:FkbM family methyltransferase
MLNIFLDIGAHTGESLEEALRPIYKLHRVYAFEPSTLALKKLMKFRDKRLRIIPLAVSNYNGESNLFGAGSVGGGLFSDKLTHWNKTEVVNVVKFSEWVLANLSSMDNVYIKINVEGSEYFILQEILKVYKNFNIKSILLSIDIDKVPSLKKNKEDLATLIANFPVQILIRQDKEVNTSINKFFILSDLVKNVKISLFSDYLRSYLPLDRNILRLIKPLFPKKIWIFTALRFGPNRAR